MTNQKLENFPAPEEEEKIKYKSLSTEHKRQMLLVFGALFIVFTAALVYFCAVLIIENGNDSKNWYTHLEDDPARMLRAQELSVDAQEVKVGTYIENLRSIDIKNSQFRIEMMVWFDWEGDSDLDPANNFRIYKGYENKRVVIDEVHENGKNYQLVGLDVTISKDFHTKLFPLESHQMRVYLESNKPIQEMIFKADHVNSGFNEDLSITGFDFERFAMNEITYEYKSTHGHPTLSSSEINSEIVSAFEIKRSGFGLYIKCFIALYATLIWMLISLFICTYHHVNPLSMVSGALFGAVGNIVVGTSLLPDGTSAGLLEFGNIGGAMIVLGGTFAIIRINRERELLDKKFAKYYGRFLFYLILAFTVLQVVLLPLIAITNW